MKPILPMEPKSSELIPAGEKWIAQVKWDGVRVLTYCDSNEVRLFNRKAHERTDHYPELTDLDSYCSADSVVLDGEVIALGQDGKPDFHRVMRRDGIRRMERVEQAYKLVPITYMIFDVLYYNGEWITNRPWSDRFEILSKIITPNPRVQLVSYHDDGNALFQAIQQQDLEGIVMKRTDSIYSIGEKSEVWLKIKNYKDLIALIGGFTLNGGIVNAVLLGLYDQHGVFWYIGHTGTGKMSKQEWRDLTDTLCPHVIKERPFANKPERHSEAFWVRPELAVKVKYAEWTEGRALRQPSIQAFVDVAPQECVIQEEFIRR